MKVSKHIEKAKKVIEKKIRRSSWDKSHPMPPYDMWRELTNEQPPFFNQKGQLLTAYYLRDVHMSFRPYYGIGQYFFWDRYNYGLNTHFYSHEEVRCHIGKPTKKNAIFFEPRSISAKGYIDLDRNTCLANEFDSIFCFDDRLLNKYANSKFFQIAAAPVYGREEGGLAYDEKAYLKKDRGISLLASDKKMTDIHVMRAELARYCRRNNLCDTFGRAVGEYALLEDTLRDYRFSFAIENVQTDYYFTEKITNCFAAQTIPIYYGARRISDFFNMDGIIVITKDDFNDIEKVLNICTREEYERRLPAVLDNYNRVLKDWTNMQDYLYEHYLVGDE